MELEALKALVIRYAKNSHDDFLSDGINDGADSSFDASFFDSTRGSKIITNIFNACDKDGNGDLEMSELYQFSDKLDGFSEFSGVSFEGFLSTVDGDYDWDSLDIAELSETEEAVKDYEDKKDIAEFMLSTDENIDAETLEKRAQLQEQIDLNYESIKPLLENKDNLSSQDKDKLTELANSRQKMLAERDKMEAELLKNASDETKFALQSMIDARDKLNDSMLMSVDSLKTIGVELDDLSTIDEPDVDETSNESESAQASAPASSAGGGSYSGGDSTISTNGGGDNPATNDSNKPLTLEELQAELSAEQATMQQNQQLLTSVMNGTDSEVAQAKGDMDTAQEEYLAILEEVSPELNEQLTQALSQKDTQQQLINGLQLEISNLTTQINGYNNTITSLSGNIASINNALASLNSTDTSSLPDDKKGEVSARIQQLTAQREQLQQQLDTANQQLSTAQADKSAKDAELVQANATMSEIDTSITSIQEQISALENEDLTAAQDKFNTAQSAYQTIIQTKSSQVQGAIDTSQAKINDLQNQINTLQNQQYEAQGKISSLSGTYLLNGVEYDALYDQDTIDSMVSAFAQGGAGNKWGHPDMCLSFAESYGAWFMGESSIPVGDDSNPNAYPDDNKYAQSDHSTKEESLAEIEHQLNDGKPVIVQCSGSSHGSYYSRHYVLVIGIKKGASSPPKESDLLIVDTYDAKVEGMKPNGSRFMTQGNTSYPDGSKRTGDYDWRLYVYK